MAGLRDRRRVETLLLVLLLAAAAPAQEAGDEAPEEQDGTPRRRILHLSGGETLRGRARPSGDGWEIELAGRTVVIPASQVVRAPLERDVLARARGLENDLERGAEADLGRHVAYADWCTREGLLDEACEALDVVLARNPDEPSARELARRLEPTLALPPLDGGPGALDRYLRKAADGGPAVREMAIARLARLGAEGDEVAGLKDRLTTDLHGWNERRREVAALGLQRLFPGYAVRDLLARAVLDGSEGVRARAARALAATGEPGVVLPVLRALDSESFAVRTNAAAALGEMGFPAAVEPLVMHLAATGTAAAQGATSAGSPRSHIFVGKQFAYVSDYDVEIAQASAIADPTISVLTEGAVLDVRVLAVTQQTVARERAVVRRALEKLTGASPGDGVDDWLAWWDANGDAWRTAPPPGPASPMSPGG